MAEGTGAVRNGAMGEAGLDPASPAGAADLIAGAADPATGAVDTRWLAHLVADAYRHDPQRADRAYAAIEQHLGARHPADAGRFNEDVREAFGADDGASLSDRVARTAGDATFGAGQGAGVAGERVTARGYRMLVDNPILKIYWEPSRSPITDKGGVTPGLVRLLMEKGIDVAPEINTPVPRSAASSRWSALPSAASPAESSAVSAAASLLRALSIG